jgi:hypothetical protein
VPHGLKQRPLLLPQQQGTDYVRRALRNLLAERTSLVGRVQRAQQSIWLTDALRHQTALAGDDPATAKHIGISVLGAVHAFTEADDSEALTLLRALRNEVLQSG